MAIRVQEPFDYGNGFCNTSMACKIFAEIRKYEGASKNLENCLRSAVHKKKIATVNIAHCLAWNKEDVKKYAEYFVSKHGDASSSNCRGNRTRVVYQSDLFKDEFLNEIRKIVKEEIAAAFK